MARRTSREKTPKRCTSYPPPPHDNIFQSACTVLSGQQGADCTQFMLQPNMKKGHNHLICIIFASHAQTTSSKTFINKHESINSAGTDALDQRDVKINMSPALIGSFFVVF